jgi:hypothetical protein
MGFFWARWVKGLVLIRTVNDPRLFSEKGDIVGNTAALVKPLYLFPSQTRTSTIDRAH